MSVHDNYKSYLNDQRRFFDELVTEDWDTYISEEWDRVRAYEAERIFDYIRPQTILDVGCGCGFHDQFLAMPDFVTRVDGIDYSEQSIKRANDVYPHSKVQRWAADFFSAEFSGPYDLVASFHVFEHLDQPEAFLMACIRNAKVGGHVLVATPNRLRLSNRIRRLKRQPLLLCDQMHFKEYVPRELIAMGKDLCLKPIGWFGVNLTELETVGLRAPDLDRRLIWGRRLPWLATSFSIVFERMA